MGSAVLCESHSESYREAAQLLKLHRAHVENMSAGDLVPLKGSWRLLQSTWAIHSRCSGAAMTGWPRSTTIIAKQPSEKIPPLMVAALGMQQVFNKSSLLCVRHPMRTCPYRGICSLPQKSDTRHAPCRRRTKAAKVEPAIELLASLYNQNKLAA